MGPRIALALLCALILVAAALHPGHAAESVDIRTYIQMVAGVARHGLPYWDNGPIDRYEELVVAWAVPADGHLWGVYAPLYAYVAAPVFALGSLRAVSGFTFAMLVPIALVTFALARRFVKSDWSATLAAALAIASTPLVAKAVEISAYPLAALLSVTATYLSIRVAAGDLPRPRLGSLGCGLAWGGAIASHALCFPMAIVSLIVLAAFAPAPAPARAARVAPAIAGLAAAMTPVALLNHVRFHAWSPLSYGPTPWRHFAETNPIVHQNVGDQLRFGMPVIVTSAVVLAGVWLLRRRRVLAVLVVLAGIGAVIGIETVRVRAGLYGAVVFGYLVDMSVFEIGGTYARAPDGIGQVHYGWLVRSMLQCTPILAIAPFLARRAEARARAATWLLLMPCAALFATLALRANMGLGDALGLPWVYLRYTVPALPMLMVASVAVLEEARLGWRDVPVALAGAAALAYPFATLPEMSLEKRVCLVIVPLAAALGAVVGAALARREGAIAVRLRRSLLALAVGVGLAGGLFQELQSALWVKRGVDAWLDHFVAVAPQRFAMFGMGGLPDCFLTTTVTHDVRYALVALPDEFERIRPILELWRDDGRPIFLMWETDPPRPWSDVVIEPVAGVDHLFTVRWRVEAQ